MGIISLRVSAPRAIRMLQLPIYLTVNGISLSLMESGALDACAIHAKGGHVEATLRARQRGVPRDLKEVEEEVAQMPDISDEPDENSYGLFVARTIDCVAFVVDKLRRATTPAMLATVFAVGVAMLVSLLFSGSG